MIESESDPPFNVRWEHAANLAGDALMEEPGYYPPRWRVRGWPPDHVVAQLRSMAVDPDDDRM